MNPKLKYGLLIGIGSLTLIGASAGATIGIFLPKTLKLKEGLSNFVVDSPGYDTYKNLANKKLYYVAIGDSITAGHNGVLKKDHYSYADFLANNLKKSGRLAAYKNFAKSKSTIYDLFREIMNEPGRIYVLSRADLISITIGSNDLLKFGKLLEIAIELDRDKFVESIIGGGKTVNEARKKLNINDGLVDPKEVGGKTYSVGDTTTTLTSGQKHHLMRKSIHKFVKMYKNKDFHEMISLQSSFRSKVFSFIKRNLSLFIRDLHKINPDAKILLIAPYFPFQHLKKEALEKEINNIGMSGKEIYSKLKTTMKEAVEFSLGGESNKFVDFIDASKLPITKSVANGKSDTRDAQRLYFEGYVKKQEPYNQNKNRNPNFIPEFWKRNALPNALDVHPSIFGQQLLGNAIFSRIYKHLKIKGGRSEDYYTFTKPYNPNLTLEQQAQWTRVDEAPGVFKFHEQYLTTNMYKGEGSFGFALTRILKSQIDKLNISSSDLQSKLDELANLKYDDYIPLLEMLDDDKIIDVLIAAFTERKKLETIGKEIINTNDGDMAERLESIIDKVKKIKEILNVLSEEDKQRLKAKLEQQELLFEKNVANAQLRNMFTSLFSFLIDPTPLNTLNLKTAFLGANAGIS